MPPLSALKGIDGQNSAAAASPGASIIPDEIESQPRALWSLHGLTCATVARNTGTAILADRLFGRAAELAFYFLFALFPTLFSASSVLGLAAKSAAQIYDHLLHYLALVIPTSALSTVLHTFNETTAGATPGKVTFGLIIAIWSASVGVSAMQDALNQVHKLNDTRSYIRARLYAIGLTILLSCLITLALSCMLGGDFAAALLHRDIHNMAIAVIAAFGVRLIAWALAAACLSLSFAAVYYWAPDLKVRRWHWITPGSVVGIFSWLLASLGLRLYLHFFNSYSLTYGSLGAVIILLTWFYITGLMLLVGAEFNMQLDIAAHASEALRCSLPEAAPAKL